MGKLIDGLKKGYSSVKKCVQKTIQKALPKKKEITANKQEITAPKQEGLTYLMENESMPFQAKIGEHHKSFDIQNRLKGLNNTSISENFRPICVIKSEHCVEIEKKLHEKFSKYRINTRREFFGFKICSLTSSNEFECIKQSYEKLLKKMVKKMHKYAAKYGGEIIV